MTPQEIQTIISEALNTTHIEVKSDDNIHFCVTVVSTDFDGLPKIKQHKLVNDLFSQQFADESIHAMSLKTLTPEKWVQKAQ